jgi:heme oxygenase
MNNLDIIPIKYIKDQTHQQHNLLEELTWAEKINNHTITKHGLAEVLKAFYVVYRNYEQQAKQAGFKLEPSRVEVLEQDITRLDAKVPKNESFSTEIRLDSEAKFMGLRYVMEGQTLGGQVITKNIQESPSINEDIKFFSIYGKDTMLNWKDFVATFNSYFESKDSHQLTEATEVAKLVFKDIYSQLKEMSAHV